MSSDTMIPCGPEGGMDLIGHSRIFLDSAHEEPAMARIGSDGRITVCSSLLSELCGSAPGELPGMHWSVLCSDDDATWLKEFKSRNPAIGSELRCYVGLPGGDEPVRVAELNLSRLPGGGWLWRIGRVSADSFPPFSSDELRKFARALLSFTPWSAHLSLDGDPNAIACPG